MNIFLMIYPNQIIIFLLILIGLTITALVMASKKKTNFHFLIWSVIIIFLPFLGSLSYILKFLTSKKEIDTIAK